MSLTSLAVDAAGRTGVVSGYSKDLAVFDLETGKNVRRLRAVHSMHVNVVRFASTLANASLLVTSSYEGCAKLWDVRTDCAKPVWSHATGCPVVMACIDPNDTTVLVSSVDHDVRSLDFRTGRFVRAFPIPRTGSATNYTRSYFARGGQYVVTAGCADSTVRVFDAARGSLCLSASLAAALPRSDISVPACIQTVRGIPSTSGPLGLVALVRDNVSADMVALTLSVV
jgi:WD40 repeat protein